MAKSETPNIPVTGMTDAYPLNVKENQYRLMLNGNIYTDISSAVTLTNDHANYLCNNLPQDFKVIGTMFIHEDNVVYLWLVNPSTGASQVGYLGEYVFTDVNDEYVPNNCDECVKKKQEAPPLETTTQPQLCAYTPIVTDGPCCLLGFNIDFPIRKGVFKKDSCGDSIYFTDFLNPPRVLKLQPGTHLPDNTQRYVASYTSPPCVEPVYDTDPTHVDCIEIQIFPKVGSHIHVTPTVVGAGGTLVAGTYQMAACYADKNGQRATRTFVMSNPVSIFDPNKTITDQVNYPTDLGIQFALSNIDNTEYKYIDIFVVGTQNGVSTIRQYDTIDISNLINDELQYVLSDFEKGTNATIDDVLQVFPVYEKAQEITIAGNSLLLANLTGPPDLNLQQAVIYLSPFIQWKSYESDESLYADGAFAADYRTYMRDELYPLGIVFERNNTLDTCVYPFVGRALNTVVSAAGIAAGYLYVGYWLSNGPTLGVYAAKDIVTYNNLTYVNTSGSPTSPTDIPGVSTSWTQVTDVNAHLYGITLDDTVATGNDVLTFPVCEGSTPNLLWQVYNTAYNRGQTCGFSPQQILCIQSKDSISCNSVIVALPTLSYTSTSTASFIVGDDITASPSGATGAVLAVSSGILVLQGVSGTFATGDTLTGGELGATGTVTSYIAGTANALPLDCYTNVADVVTPYPCADNYPVLYNDASVAPPMGCPANTVPSPLNYCTGDGHVRSYSYSSGAGASHPLCIDSALAQYNTQYNTGANALGVPYAVLTGSNPLQIFPGGTQLYGKYNFLTLLNAIPTMQDPTPSLEGNYTNCAGNNGGTWLWNGVNLSSNAPANNNGNSATNIIVTPTNNCIYWQSPEVAPLMYFLGNDLVQPSDYNCPGSGPCPGTNCCCAGSTFAGDYWQTNTPNWNSATTYVTGDVVFYLGLTYTAVAGSTNVNPVGNPAKWGTGSTINNNVYQSYWYNFYATAADTTLVIRVKLFDKLNTPMAAGDYRIDVYESTPNGVALYSTGDTNATYYYDGSGTTGDVDAGVLIIGDVANSTGDTHAGAHGSVPPQAPLVAGTQYFLHIYLLAPGVAKLNVRPTPNPAQIACQLSSSADCQCPCFLPDYAWANICISAPEPSSQISITLPAEYQLQCVYDIYYRQNQIPPTFCNIKPFEYGEFAYWQAATRVYPNSLDQNGNPLWGPLCGLPIRHFKFPDCLVSYLQDQDPYISGSLGSITDYPYNAGRTAKIYPIGLKINTEDVKTWLEWAVSVGLITLAQMQSITGYKIVRGNRATNKSVGAKGILMDMWRYQEYDWINKIPSIYNTWFANYPFNCLLPDPYLSEGPTGNQVPLNHPFDGLQNSRFAFHSPDCSFNAPTIGDELKLEASVFGGALGAFYQVQDHPLYVLLSSGGIGLAAALAGIQWAADFLVLLGTVLGNPVVGVSFTVPTGSVVGAIGAGLEEIPKFFIYAEQWEQLILEFGVPQNFAYYYAAVGNYHSSGVLGLIGNTGNKRRLISNGTYLIGGNLQINEQGNLSKINNYEREDSVYFHLNNAFVYGGTVLNDPALLDTSKFIMSQSPNFQTINNSQQADTHPCGLIDRKSQVASNYASMKYYLPDQYGSLQDIEWIYTGVFEPIDFGIECGSSSSNDSYSQCDIMLGGDEFICRFTKYIKLPFFLDNPVGTTSPVDWQYYNLANITSPIYFFNSVGENALNSSSIQFQQVENNFDCNQTGAGMYLKGNMYLFSYGVISFICESDFNLNFRRCTNITSTRGFYPYQSDIQSVTQEYQVPIETPNSYLYNRDYSKQNKENYFCSQPTVYHNQPCVTTYRNRVITSIPDIDPDFYHDNWKIFLGADYYDFPLAHGYLNGIYGIERDRVLVLLSETNLVFNAFYTINTHAGAAEIGSAETGQGASALFSQKPEQETQSDIGYGGTESHAFVSTPMGHFWVDPERHKVFVLPPQKKSPYAENNPVPISESLDTFFITNLPFFILLDFPTFPTDNPYKDVGLTMDWDYRFGRLFLTKLDYQLLPQWAGQATYMGDDPDSPGKALFVIDGENVHLDNCQYFCNKSWTISYSPALKTWISYHSFVPNYYVGHSKYLQTGVNFVRPGADQGGIWNHFISNRSYQVYYGTLYPFIVDIVIQEQLYNKQLQSIEYQTDFLRFQNDYDYFYNPEHTFNKMVIWTENQNSGNLVLVPQKKNDFSQIVRYPSYGPDSTTIMVTRKTHNWRVNQFWDMVANKENNVPPMLLGCNPYLKTVNPSAIWYQRPSFIREHIVSDYINVRLVNDIYSNYKIIYKWQLNNTIKSYS